MGFSLLSYQLATGGAVTDGDMTALVDADFTTRSNHYIFTEDYKLGASCVLGATVTRANIQTPTWNAVGRFNVWPVIRSLVIPSPPQMDWYLNTLPPLPTNEEFTIKVTDTALETAQAFVWLLSNDWTANLPPGRLLIPVRFTATGTIIANAWSALVAITMEQSLRGGVYAVVGASLQGTNVTAFRIVFPRYRLYRGRKLRPGFLATNAIGDTEEPRIHANRFLFGEWGRFHTFEQPQLEITGSTAGAQALEGRMWLVYLGEDQQLLNQGLGGGM